MVGTKPSSSQVYTKRRTLPPTDTSTPGECLNDHRFCPDLDTLHHHDIKYSFPCRRYKIVLSAPILNQFFFPLLRHSTSRVQNANIPTTIFPSQLCTAKPTSNTYHYINLQISCQSIQTSYFLPRGTPTYQRARPTNILRLSPNHISKKWHPNAHIDQDTSPNHGTPKRGTTPRRVSLLKQFTRGPRAVDTDQWKSRTSRTRASALQITQRFRYTG